MNTYTVKNVKRFRGTEGLGFGAVLCRDGKPIADVLDEGRGGACHFSWRDMAEMLDFRAYVRGLPAMDSDLYVAHLVDRCEAEKRLRQMCRRAVLFMVHGDKPGSYRTRPGMYTPGVGRAIRAMYGDRLVEIANERYR